jgi:anti-sigma factor RsiW
MPRHEPDDLDRRIDALIGGELDPDQREQLLAALVDDAGARHRLAEQLHHRQALRTAFGYDRAVDDIARHLPELQGRLRRRQQVDRRRQATRWWFGNGLKLAALIALAVSLALAWHAQQNSEALRRQVTRLQQERAGQRDTPRMRMTTNEISRYRTLFKHAASGVEPGWMLVSGDGGQGRFASRAQSNTGEQSRHIVAVRWRVENDDRKQVYQGTLLLPEGRRVAVDVAAADNAFDKPLLLSVNAGQSRAAGFWLKGPQGDRLGVASRMPTSTQGGRLGSFRAEGERYHVYVQRRRLNRPNSAI